MADTVSAAELADLADAVRSYQATAERTFLAVAEGFNQLTARIEAIELELGFRK